LLPEAYKRSLWFLCSLQLFLAKKKSALWKLSQSTKQHLLISNIMADRRPEAQEMSRAKRPRTGELDPSTNPYLAHMYENTDNGANGSAQTGLSHFKRHATTALQAHAAEDGPNNPFNNVPLSERYFNILKTRRDLPVHKQR
jgi:hypothetical protein